MSVHSVGVVYEGSIQTSNPKQRPNSTFWFSSLLGSKGASRNFPKDSSNAYTVEFPSKDDVVAPTKSTCCNTLYANFALVAEALTMRGAVLLAQNLHLSSILCESNCLQLVQACRKETIIKEIEGVLNDIWIMCSSFELVGFSWICREGNTVAHTIVSLASSRALMGNWCLNPPTAPRQALDQDKRSIEINGRNNL